MDTGELLNKITALPIISGGLAEEMLAGNFRSIFKGQGMEFDEARHYLPGDDIRSIDWNASARFGTPFVKMYREERELTILVLMDVSPSMHRGYIDNQKMSPYEQALICAALIAFSADHTEQPIGAFFFDKDIEQVFPPHKGRKHIMAFIMAALKYQNKISVRKEKSGSDIKAALKGAQRILKRRSLVIVISDFFSMNWEQEIAELGRKHDVIALRICDPPDILQTGLVTLEDPETGIKIEAPAGMESFKDEWLQWHTERSAGWEAACKRSGISFLELNTADDALAKLLKLFGRHGHQGRKK